ncbi:MAG TPA: ECF-type sigma factor [Bryobacteraceae bacterium]|nr:ECF-type sigma factor [Bryobacteraceae bacterium]
MELTQLLQRIQAGEPEALNAVIPLVYNELKKLASAHLHREGPAQPLQTTELVHEAFLRLAGSRQPSYENRAHFFGIASRLMRQVLVDAARARTAEKRSAAAEVALADIPDFGAQPHRALLAMDDALNQLALADPLKVTLVEMRYFGGMTAQECAGHLSISVHIVRRELRLATAWLRKEMAASTD